LYENRRMGMHGGSGGLGLVTGCSTAPKSVEARADLDQAVQDTIATARQTDPGLQGFFDSSAGYAVFPTVGKGAVAVGGHSAEGNCLRTGN